MNLATNQYIKFRDFSRQQLIRKFAIQFAYGHREILLNYSKLDTTSLFIGIIQHGVGPASFLTEWPTPRFRSLNRSSLWVYSNVAVARFLAEGAKNVSAIGSPWLYSKILDNYQDRNQCSKLKFLVFAHHYSFNYLSQVTPEEILGKIRDWQSIAGPEELEVCLYWTEFIDRTWQRIAREEGVTLVCAGLSQSAPEWSQTDSRINFYANLRQIIDSATHCIFESFTSAIFYAKDLGKNVGIYQSESSLREINRELAFQKENDWLLKNVPGIFNSFESSSLLDSITYELLGYDELLSPENLANVLRYQKGVIPIRFNPFELRT